MFVSNIWGGNVSDRYITEQCGFLDIVKLGDEVMADRFFFNKRFNIRKKGYIEYTPSTKKCSWEKGKHLTAHAVLKTTKNCFVSMLNEQLVD